MHPKHVTEKNMKIYFEIYTYLVACPLFWPLFNMLSCQALLKTRRNMVDCTYLQYSYYRYDYLNFKFANLIISLWTAIGNYMYRHSYVFTALWKYNG